MITDAERKRLGASFELAADVYERARPGYASAAVDWLLPSGARTVLDLAAGTGKLTEALSGRGADLIAIDPSPAMLAQLARRQPDVDARLGTAEATGLADRSVDAVVIGSALHWFDRPAADREIARILRPGGVVGVFGNQRDRSVAWVAALGDLVRGVGGRRSELRDLDPARFSPPSVASFPHSQVLDADGLADLVASRSYVISMPIAEREALKQDVRAFARTNPELAHRDRFELPYLTVVRRYQLLPG